MVNEDGSTLEQNGKEQYVEIGGVKFGDGVEVHGDIIVDNLPVDVEATLNRARVEREAKKARAAGYSSHNPAFLRLVKHRLRQHETEIDALTERLALEKAESL